MWYNTCTCAYRNIYLYLPTYPPPYTYLPIRNGHLAFRRRPPFPQETSPLYLSSSSQSSHPNVKTGVTTITRAPTVLSICRPPTPLLISLQLFSGVSICRLVDGRERRLVCFLFLSFFFFTTSSTNHSTVLFYTYRSYDANRYFTTGIRTRG